MKKIAILLTCLMVIACSNNDDNTANVQATDINLVTGIIAAENIFSAGFLLGNPNIRMPKSLSSVSVYTYPKPATSNLVIDILQSAEVITDIWFVKANAQMLFQDTNFEELMNEDTYTTNQISQSATQTFNDLSTTNMTINLEGYESGYYRVFINTTESLYWDNVYIDNSGVDIVDFFETWDEEF